METEERKKFDEFIIRITLVLEMKKIKPFKIT